MPGAGLARLFVALELPAAQRERLCAWGREAAREAARHGGALRVLDAESLHLTLSFLGSRAAAEVEELAGELALACAGSGPIALSLGAPVWLPPRRPRALAVEVRDEDGALGALQGAVAAALEDAEARRRYRPHITVARAGAGFRAPREPLPVSPAASFSACSVALMRSWLEPSGARYEAQARVPLG